MRCQPFSVEDQANNRDFGFWGMARRSVSLLMDARILKRIRFLAAIVSVFCLPSVYATAQSNSNSPLGTNLAGVNYYSAEQPFLNIFKTGGGWTTVNGGTGPDTAEEVALISAFSIQMVIQPHCLPGGIQIQCFSCAFVTGAKFQ